MEKETVYGNAMWEMKREIKKDMLKERENEREKKRKKQWCALCE